MAKSNKKLEKWAILKLEKIQKVLLLNDYYPLNIEPSGKENVSECEYTYPYKSINIRYSDDVSKSFDKKEYSTVLDILTHEMCHVLTDPLYTKGIQRYLNKNEYEDERERLTDHIANIIRKNKLV